MTRIVPLGTRQEPDGTGYFYRHEPSNNVVGVTVDKDGRYHAYTEGQRTGYRSTHGDGAGVMRWLIGLFVELKE